MSLINYIISLDEFLFFTINNLPHTSVTDAIFLFFSFYPLLIWALIGVTIVVIEERRDNWFVIKLVMALILSGFIASGILKPVIKRPRPDISHGAQVVLVDEKPAVVPWNNDFAFPSGHAAVAFAGAYIVTRVEATRLAEPKRTRMRNWLFWLLAGMTAISRIYLGKHYPIDILFGAGVGWITGWAVWRVVDLFSPPKAY